MDIYSVWPCPCRNCRKRCISNKISGSVLDVIIHILDILKKRPVSVRIQYVDALIEANKDIISNDLRRMLSSSYVMTLIDDALNFFDSLKNRMLIQDTSTYKSPQRVFIYMISQFLEPIWEIILRQPSDPSYRDEVCVGKPYVVIRYRINNVPPELLTLVKYVLMENYLPMELIGIIYNLIYISFTYNRY